MVLKRKKILIRTPEACRLPPLGFKTNLIYETGQGTNSMYVSSDTRQNSI